MERNHTQFSLIIPILHYPPVIGGFEVFLENVAERISQRTPVYIITGKVAETPRYEDKGNVHITRTASLYALTDFSYSSYWYVLTALPFLFWKTLMKVKKEQRALMHANGFFSGLVCYFVSLVTGVPYVMTIQSADFTIYHPEARFVVRLQMAVERAIYGRARVCHAVSTDLCAHYKRQGIGACVMIPNGVETNVFKPLKSEDRERVRDVFGLPQHKHVVVTTSRLEHKNGVQDLIVAVSKLPDVYLAVVGNGSKRAELEALAREHSVADRVLFLGQVLHERVGELVASADVYARTPLSEGFGIVFLEAMAAQVPVVATPVGGIPDFLEDGVTGLFATAGDPESIAKTLSRALTDVELRGKLIENGSRLVSERYDWDQITSRLEGEVYARAL